MLVFAVVFIFVSFFFLSFFKNISFSFSGEFLTFLCFLLSWSNEQPFNVLIYCCLQCACRLLLCLLLDVCLGLFQQLQQQFFCLYIDNGRSISIKYHSIAFAFQVIWKPEADAAIFSQETPVRNQSAKRINHWPNHLSAHIYLLRFVRRLDLRFCFGSIFLFCFARCDLNKHIRWVVHCTRFRNPYCCYHFRHYPVAQRPTAWLVHWCLLAPSMALCCGVSFYFWFSSTLLPMCVCLCFLLVYLL